MRSAGVGGVFVCVMDAGCEECWCRRGVCVCDGCWMSGVLV